MARRRLEGLERVLGANALFSTAYGNVGSSIYYALGLVASYALGLTPVVFVITGFFFFCTAATYAEATTMYPEAGGSASFARRAFNEFWSFFAAWTGMLTYVCTIAISAFFVPHYIGGLFWDALRHSPGDIIGGAIVIIVLAAINVFGAKESTGVNVLLAVIDFMTQLLLVVLGIFLVFSPQVLVDNVHLGVAPEWKDFVLAIPIGMLAYTGIETISNMSEEALGPAKTIPAAINRVRLAVFAIYFTLPAVALSALPVQQHLGQEVGDRQRHVQRRRLLDAADVDDRQHDDHERAGDDVAGRVAQFLPEQPADVVRDEERGDRDRRRVGQHLRPGGEERPELVERAAREARRAARLREHRRRLGVRRGGAEEEHPGDQEDDRGETQRVARDEAERVVDRRSDVAVGRREEGVDPQDALEAVQSAFRHVNRRRV